jgi:peptide/nickel transport system substrate-binding protein
LCVVAVIISSCSSAESISPAKTSATSAASSSHTSSLTSQTSDSSTLTETPKRGGILRGAGPPDPGGPFGWPPEINGPAAACATPALETLLRQNLDGSYYPWLAESWDIASDKLSITFYLREDVQFFDGTPFNADAVKFNFDAQIEALRQPFWKSIDVLDDYTVRLNLNSWSNAIFDTFADASYIVSPTFVRENGIEAAYYNPVGTGPFILEEYLPNTRISFVRNENYWQEGKPYLDGFVTEFITDSLTMKAAFKANQLDFISVSLGKDEVEMRELGYETSVLPMTTYTLIPDTVNASSPFAILEVRQAVEYALDRESMADGLGYGQWIAPYQLPPRSTSAYDPDFTGGLQYDPDKAKQLLAQAGYPNGFSTAIIAQPAARQDDANAAIQHYLNEVGINTEIKNVDQATFSDYQLNGWSDSLMVGVISGWANYNNTLRNYFAPSSTQFISWEKTDEFVALLDASMKASEMDADLIRKVTDYLIENALVIPTTESGIGFAYNSYIKDSGMGERGSPTNFNFENIWLDK